MMASTGATPRPALRGAPRVKVHGALARDRRIELGLDLAVVAAGIGVEPTTLGRYELELAKPPLAIAGAWAAVLGLPLATLVVDHRPLDMLQRVRTGEPLRDVAADHRLSNSVVLQIVVALDPGAAEAGRAARAERRRAKRAADRAKRLAAYPPCVVCLGPMQRTPKGKDGVVTCSERCAGLYIVTRYHLNPAAREKQRLATARYMAANPDPRRPLDVAHARRVLNGTARRRPRLVPYSDKVRDALRQVALLRGVPFEEFLSGILDAGQEQEQEGLSGEVGSCQ